MESNGICPKCGIKLPFFTEDGKHNFVPSVDQNGKIINLCMKCKMEEVTRKWKGKNESSWS